MISSYAVRTRLPSPQRGEVNCRTAKPALNIKIQRHALPRGAFGCAEICRRRLKDRLPRLPLHRTLDPINRALEAGIRIAAAGGVSAARFQPTRSPQPERVAVAPLLQSFLGGKPHRVLLRRKLPLAGRLGQSDVLLRQRCGPRSSLERKTPPAHSRANESHGNTARSFPRKRESRHKGTADVAIHWVPAFAGTSGAQQKRSRSRGALFSAPEFCQTSEWR
jgi:hypothetical protein